MVPIQCCSGREHNTFGSGNILILSPVQEYLTQDCDNLAYSSNIHLLDTYYVHNLKSINFMDICCEFSSSF
jgi:hypothetical protein